MSVVCRVLAYVGLHDSVLALQELVSRERAHPSRSGMKCVSQQADPLVVLCGVPGCAALPARLSALGRAPIVIHVRGSLYADNEMAQWNISRDAIAVPVMPSPHGGHFDSGRCFDADFRDPVGWDFGHPDYSEEEQRYYWAEVINAEGFDRPDGTYCSMADWERDWYDRNAIDESGYVDEDGDLSWGDRPPDRVAIALEPPEYACEFGCDDAPAGRCVREGSSSHPDPGVQGKGA